MAKSNEIKDLEALLSESNIDAEIQSILEELDTDETAEKTEEVEEISASKDTDGSVLDQDPSTKDAIDSGLAEPGVAGDNEVVIPDEDKKVDVVITVEKDKEPTEEPTLDAEVDETVDKLSAELNQTELGESFTNIYNILSDNINDIDEKSFEADYEEYKDDGKECISVDQVEGKECESDCLKDTEIKTDLDTSKLNEDEEPKEDEKDKKNKKYRKINNAGNIALGAAATGFGIKKTADQFKKAADAKADMAEINKLQKDKEALKDKEELMADIKKANAEEDKAEETKKETAKDDKPAVEENKEATTETKAEEAKTDAAAVEDKEKLSAIDKKNSSNAAYDRVEKEADAIKKNIENNKFAGKSDAELAKATSDAKGAELAGNALGTLAAIGSAALLGKTISNVVRHVKDKKEELAESEDMKDEDKSEDIEVSEDHEECEDCEKSEAIEALKDLIDIHGDENALVITKKGELDKPGAAMIKVKVTKEQRDSLKHEFCEEKEEEVAPVVTESQVALMIARENNDRLFAELVEATALANRLQNAICEKYADLAKDKAASLNEQLSVWSDTFEEKVDAPAQPLVEERYVTLDELCEVLDESGYEVNEESLANLIIDIINEDVVLELSEASSAEKRAYKEGGEDMADLIDGKAIARIKDKKTRDAAVAAKKVGREDLVKSFIGDRREEEARDSIDDKTAKMKKAGIKGDESVYHPYYKMGDLEEVGEPAAKKEAIKEEVKNVRMAKTASEVNNFYTTDFSEKKDVCDKECEDKENCDCFTVTKDVDNHTDVELSDASANVPEEGKVGAEEDDWFNKDETTDVKEVIVESEEFNSVAKEFLEENDYEVDDENISLIKEAYINGKLAELDENLTEGFLTGKIYAKKAAALTTKINKKRETEKDASKELAKLDKVVNKARAHGVSIEYADVDGRVSLSIL